MDHFLHCLSTPGGRTERRLVVKIIARKEEHQCGFDAHRWLSDRLPVHLAWEYSIKVPNDRVAKLVGHERPGQSLLGTNTSNSRTRRVVGSLPSRYFAVSAPQHDHRPGKQEQGEEKPQRRN
ncbi:hypothetical protein H101_05153, partial [Trichophyton interdigitale H6]